MNNYSIFDIETNGLLHEERDEKGGFKLVATKIHCMSVCKVVNGNSKCFTLTSYDEMIDFLWGETCLVGHNIQRFDIPVLEKFLKMDLSKIRKIDTLALSWYLYPLRHEHGLDSWGDTLGIQKPPVEDWENDSIDTYVYRCQEDVKINTALLNIEMEYLMQIYDRNTDDVDRLINYLSWKLEVAKEQEFEKWRLDHEFCETNLAKLKQEREEKIKILSDLMPPVIKSVMKERPKVCYKKDGSLSEHGKKWKELCESRGLTVDNLVPIKVITGEERGNPGSHQQMKDWLFTLGWKPVNVKIDRDKRTNEVKKIPQLSNQDGTDVDDGIKDLYEKVPELEALSGLFVIRHRIGILEGFLERVDRDGYLKAQVKGLTNTLRFQHTTIVNLPQIPKPYWEEVRGCLIADDGTELCGSDMGGLEDNTKHHYMYYFDPEYVIQMRTPGFDPHIDISVRAKAMSYDEGEFYKWYDKKKEGKVYEYTPTKEFQPTANSILTGKWHNLTFTQLIVLPDDEQAAIIKILKPIRLKNKKGNFAAVYGAGVAKLAITLGTSEPESKKFHVAYWIRNRSVKQVSDSCITKTVGSQMWLYNPVSKMWLTLREEKDKFSTLNQSTGVYCFDTWTNFVRRSGIRLKGQFHDEIITKLLKQEGEREKVRGILTDAIDLTNKVLNLNVPLRISIDFGHRYSEIH